MKTKVLREVIDLLMNQGKPTLAEQIKDEHMVNAYLSEQKAIKEFYKARREEAWQWAIMKDGVYYIGVMRIPFNQYLKEINDAERNALRGLDSRDEYKNYVNAYFSEEERLDRMPEEEDNV